MAGIERDSGVWEIRGCWIRTSAAGPLPRHRPPQLRPHRRPLPHPRQSRLLSFRQTRPLSGHSISRRVQTRSRRKGCSTVRPTMERPWCFRTVGLRQLRTYRFKSARPAPANSTRSCSEEVSAGIDPCQVVRAGHTTAQRCGWVWIPDVKCPRDRSDCLATLWSWADRRAPSHQTARRTGFSLRL